MKTLLKYASLFVIVTLIVTGCSRNRIVRAPDLPSSVTDITEEITLRATDQKSIKDQTIIMTSMVDVDDFRQSSDFGRLFSESLMTNLERFGWRVIDYRGVEVITKVKGGEFYLDRSKLKDFGDNYLIVVGTYGEYDESLLVNVRVLNHTTNEMVVSSNVLIEDEESVELSKVDNCKTLTCKGKGDFSMKIVEDDCKTTGRCHSVECTSGDCGK